MQKLFIGMGENPPEVTVGALALIDYFTKANKDQKGDSFKCFVLIVAHFVDPERFPLPQSFEVMGLTGPPEELASFFQKGGLSENTRAALNLLSDGENADGNDFEEFLEMAKQHFTG